MTEIIRLAIKLPRSRPAEFRAYFTKRKCRMSIVSAIVLRKRLEARDRTKACWSVTLFVPCLSSSFGIPDDPQGIQARDLIGQKLPFASHTCWVLSQFFESGGP